MTAQDDVRLAGRHPEFARMSLKPGIGFDGLHEIASQLMRFNLVDSQGDVPSALRHGSRLLPLGRYLRMNLRRMVGEEAKAPLKSILESEIAVQKLLEAAGVDPSPLSGEYKDLVIKNAIMEVNEAKIPKLEGRNKIFKKRGSI